MSAAHILKLVPLDARPAPAPPPEPEELILQPYRLFSECAAEAPAAISFWQGAEKKRRKRCAAKLEPRRPAPKAVAPEPQPYGPIQLQPLPLEAWRPAPRRRAPVRVAGLHPYVERRARPGARPKSIGTTPLSELERAELNREEAWLRAAGILEQRPRLLGECDDEPGPCPWVGCSANLYLDVNEDTGAIKLNFPDKEVWELEETCVHRVVAANADGLFKEEVGRLVNLTLERVSQIERIGLEKLRELPPARRGK